MYPGAWSSHRPIRLIAGYIGNPSEAWRASGSVKPRGSALEAELRRRGHHRIGVDGGAECGRPDLGRIRLAVIAAAAVLAAANRAIRPPLLTLGEPLPSRLRHGLNRWRGSCGSLGNRGRRGGRRRRQADIWGERRRLTAPEQRREHRDRGQRRGGDRRGPARARPPDPPSRHGSLSRKSALLSPAAYSSPPR
jgi:hypothetical protein